MLRFSSVQCAQKKRPKCFCNIYSCSELCTIYKLLSQTLDINHRFVQQFVVYCILFIVPIQLLQLYQINHHYYYCIKANHRVLFKLWWYIEPFLDMLMCGSHPAISTTFTNINCGAKTLYYFISAITLSNVLQWNDYWYIYSNKFGTKRHQNRQSLLKHIFTVLCQMQHSHKCSLPTSGS